MIFTVDGIAITDATLDPTGRFPVDPATYNAPLREFLERELRNTRYGAWMPVVDLNDRDSLIAWMAWNDRNGCFTDADCESEGMEPFKLADARELFLQILTTD